MEPMRLAALEYVIKSNGGATKENFIEDHDPIGEQLWMYFCQKGWVHTLSGRVFITDIGKQAFDAANTAK